MMCLIAAQNPTTCHLHVSIGSLVVLVRPVNTCQPVAQANKPQKSQVFCEIANVIDAVVR
jgi:hypothetical protein